MTRQGVGAKILEHPGAALNQLLKPLQWILKAAIFFTLFAFALNNPHEVVVHFFFGTEWRAPLVLVVLIVFVLGVALGALTMVPRWWRQRRMAKLAPHADAVSAPPPPSPVDTPHGV